MQLSFAIVGVQKAGTTVLTRYLQQNPQVYLPAAKETHYFRRDPIDGLNSKRPIDHLHRHYENADGECQKLGDATPVYIYWPHSIELLKRHNPEMKVVISLRHPVLRAYSAWSMEKKRGREQLSFSDAIRSGRHRVGEARGGVHLIYSYVERGFYAEQVSRVLEHFNRDQLFLCRAEDINVRTSVLSALNIFLTGNDFSFQPIEENVFPGSIPFLQGDEELRRDFEYLQQVYDEDLTHLQSMVPFGIDEWMSPPTLP